MNNEILKHLITWVLLVSTICIVLGIIYEIRNCNGQLIYNSIWLECIKDE